MYAPVLAVGAPVASLTLIDTDDEIFNAPGDESGVGQSALVDGSPAVINSIQQAVGVSAVVAIINGVTVNLSLTVARVVVETGLIDTTYIVFPDLPPGATIISISLPLVFPNNLPMPLCFGGETMIDTLHGPRRAIDLKAGDIVETLDHGARKIIWVGKKSVNFVRRPDMEKHRPIIFEPGCIDGALPLKRLRLSPQHRVLVTGWRAELFFGIDSVLASAKSLINGTTIRPDTDCQQIEYVHLLLEKHELVRAEGAPCETLLLGDVTMGVAGDEMRDELLAIFPDLEALAVSMTSARMAVKTRDARVLVQA